MKVIVNREAPPKILERLACFAEIVPFWAPLLEEKALRGHADLFLTQVDDTCIMAPDAPQNVQMVPHLAGTIAVDDGKAAWGAYNVAAGRRIAIGNEKYVDATVLEALKGHHLLSVRQSMARCNALILEDDAVITSDGGIAKAIAKKGWTCLLVSPKEIILPGYRNGCFGGCCGIREGTVFLTGSLKYHPDGAEIARYIHLHNMKLKELSDAPLFDVGSLFFL
ncbi:MAG: hypothetical protein SPJ13_01855 [Bacteroidales bacterium]|nr:hypothetical protein [Bacteroidales bacterium]